jgi:hypothetical protein
MEWLPVQLVLMLSLVTANLECVARCIGQSCHASTAVAKAGNESRIPPCHREQQQAPEVPQQPCKYPVLVADSVRITDLDHPLTYGRDILPVVLGALPVSVGQAQIVRHHPTAAISPPELALSTVRRL